MNCDRRKWAWGVSYFFDEMTQAQSLLLEVGGDEYLSNLNLAQIRNLRAALCVPHIHEEIKLAPELERIKLLAAKLSACGQEKLIYLLTNLIYTEERNAQIDALNAKEKAEELAAAQGDEDSYY